MSAPDPISRRTPKRRTRYEAAAVRMVDAIAILVEVAEGADAVALEDARAAVEQWLPEDLK